MEFRTTLSSFISIFKLLTISCLLFTSEGRRPRHIPCTTRIDVLSDVGVKIEPLNRSHVLVDSLSREFGDDHMITFDFKTTSSNGTLFYATRRHDLYDMVSVVIVDGHIQFKIRCKSSYADLTMSSLRVDDGEWHKVAVIRRKQKGSIRVDNKMLFRPIFLTCGGFTSLNFGNVSPEHEDSVSVTELKELDGQFDGCIRNMETTTGIGAPPHYVAVSECN